MQSLEIFLEQIKFDGIKQTSAQLNLIETNGLFDTGAQDRPWGKEFMSLDVSYCSIMHNFNENIALNNL